MSGLGLKLALALAFVIALIWLMQRVARRWGSVMGGGVGAEKIRLLSQRPLGPRLSLAVVQVMDRTLLLGISPQGIQNIADLCGAGSPSTVDRAVGVVTASPAGQAAVPRGREVAAEVTAKILPIASMAPAVNVVSATNVAPAEKVALAANAAPAARIARAADIASAEPPEPTIRPSFEAELAARLAGLHERCRSVREMESTLEGKQA